MLNISKKNVTSVIAFIFIIGLIIFCWKIFISNKKLDQKEYPIAIKYEKIIKNINIKNIQSLNKAENFIIENHNIYGTLTALFLSKQYILYNKLNEALIVLNNSLKYTQEENLNIILKLNTAKIKIEQNENQQAIKILQEIQNHNWDNIIENMKGDAFMNINNKQAAIKSWEKALLIENSNASKEIINMKIHNIKDED
ncbi:tetratricopeptide repeat protein [Buchnera aphidicola]|uniref:Ancillary SecYEG translocon subunit n=1 Tax=Buchnera aphidicola subsp. Uroleucon sonchi TaxID=118118 RepID=A0A6C1FBF1_BUCUN|nr:tetratricopeptide repeat protein [Buchnera aphidicola]QIE02268.1 tetratricopeptide repeat protein [Buchnera aphidicola (Uroleucon sonchi)]